MSTRCTVPGTKPLSAIADWYSNENEVSRYAPVQGPAKGQNLSADEEAGMQYSRQVLNAECK